MIKKTALFFLTFILLCSNVWAQETYHYSVHNVLDRKKRFETSNFTFVLKDLNSGEKTVTLTKDGKEHSQIEEYLLDPKYSTLSWHVTNQKKKTTYSGRREGNKLYVKGQLKGKAVDRTIKIDDKPFYFNPKIGLKDFVISNKDSIEFWGIRHDNLDEYKLRAQKKAVEMVKINGKKVEAIRVYWAPKGGFKKFFYRNYWFRKSDGVFLKSKMLGGWVKSLVKEEE